MNKATVHCVSIGIEFGHEQTVRAWWGEIATHMRFAVLLRENGIVAQTVFLDVREGHTCVLLYSRQKMTMVTTAPTDESDEVKELRTFYEANLDVANPCLHEVLYDVDRIAELDATQLVSVQHPGAHGLMLTGETQCLRIRIQPGKTQQVRDYFATLKQRGDLAEVLRNEVVLIETVCLDPCEDADYLIFYARMESLQSSREAFAASMHPIDVEARAFMAETWDVAKGVTRLEVLYDVDRIAEIVKFY